MVLWAAEGSLSLPYSFWGFHWFDPGAEDWTIETTWHLSLYSSGLLQELTHVLSPTRHSQGSQASYTVAHALGQVFQNTRAEASRLLRTWPCQSQSIPPFVQKTAEPARFEDDWDLTLTSNRRSSKECISVFSSSKGRMDALGHTVR